MVGGWIGLGKKGVGRGEVADGSRKFEGEAFRDLGSGENE